MKDKVSKLTDLNFSLTSSNKALVKAQGEVPTLGWSDPELGNDRLGDGTLHIDFLAEPPAGVPGQAISPIKAHRSFPLGPQPQDITVHSASNDSVITLPPAGDPP